MTKPAKLSHTTADEVKFLSSLNLPGLRAYFIASHRRADWAGMDGEAVLAYCRKRIERFEAGSVSC